MKPAQTESSPMHPLKCSQFSNLSSTTASYSSLDCIRWWYRRWIDCNRSLLEKCWHLLDLAHLIDWIEEMKTETKVRKGFAMSTGSKEETHLDRMEKCTIRYVHQLGHSLRWWWGSHFDDCSLVARPSHFACWGARCNRFDSCEWRTVRNLETSQLWWKVRLEPPKCDENRDRSEQWNSEKSWQRTDVGDGGDCLESRKRRRRPLSFSLSLSLFRESRRSFLSLTSPPSTPAPTLSDVDQVSVMVSERPMDVLNGWDPPLQLDPVWEYVYP